MVERMDDRNLAEEAAYEEEERRYQEFVAETTRILDQYPIVAMELANYEEERGEKYCVPCLRFVSERNHGSVCKAKVK